MGWLFSYSIRTRKDMIEHLRRPDRFNEGWQLLASTAAGNNHWYLIKAPSGRVTIGLDKMAGGAKDGWGYKDMDEGCGPYEFNCPLHFLDKASPPEGHAIAWREKVRVYHAQQAARPEPVVGAVVEYGGHCYRLERPAAPRRGWSVTRTGDGQRFRMSARQLNQAKFIGAVSQA